MVHREDSRWYGYGVHRVPAVVIDGKLAGCCQAGPVDAATLRAAGLGTA
jgi:glutaredoxin 3